MSVSPTGLMNERSTALLILGIVAMVALLGLILGPAISGKAVWWDTFRRGGSPEARGDYFRAERDIWAAQGAKAELVPPAFAGTCRLQCWRQLDADLTKCAELFWTNWMAPCKDKAWTEYYACVDGCGQYYPHERRVYEPIRPNI